MDLILLSDKLREMAEFQLSASGLNASRYLGQTHEVMVRRSDGSEFPASVRVGQVAGHGKLELIACVRDMSRFRQMESDRFQDQKRLETLLCASPITIYTRSVTGSQPITWVSQASSQMFGLEPLEITENASFWTNRVHPEDQPGQEELRKSLRKNGNSHTEYRLKLEDGSYRWIADTRARIYDEQGNPSLLVGYWMDIHEKKLAQLELELNQVRLRVGLEHSGMSTWDWVMQSGELQFSPESMKLHGMESDCQSGMDELLAVVHSEDRNSLNNAFRKALVSGDSLHTEYRVVWPDRSIHWVGLTGSFMNNAQGNPVRMVGVMTDITDQKQLRVAAAKIA